MLMILLTMLSLARSDDDGCDHIHGFGLPQGEAVPVDSDLIMLSFQQRSDACDHEWVFTLTQDGTEVLVSEPVPVRFPLNEARLVDVDLQPLTTYQVSASRGGRSEPVTWTFTTSAELGTAPTDAPQPEFFDGSFNASRFSRRHVEYMVLGDLDEPLDGAQTTEVLLPGTAELWQVYPRTETSIATPLLPLPAQDPESELCVETRYRSVAGIPGPLSEHCGMIRLHRVGGCSASGVGWAGAWALVLPLLGLRRRRRG